VFNENNEIIKNKSFRGLNSKSNIDNVDSSKINTNFIFESHANKVIENREINAESDLESKTTKVLQDYEINSYLRRPILINSDRINSDESSSSVVSLDLNSKYSNKNHVNFTHVNFTNSIINENDSVKNKFFNENNEIILNYINNSSSRVYDIDNCNNNIDNVNVNYKSINNIIDKCNKNVDKCSNKYSCSNNNDDVINFSLKDNSAKTLKFSSRFKEKSKSKTTQNPEAKNKNRLNLTEIDQEFEIQRNLTRKINFNSSKSSMKVSKNKLDNYFEKEKTCMKESKEMDDEEIKFKSKVPNNIKNKNYEPKESSIEQEKNIILIVDDNKFIRESFKCLLNKVLEKFNLENKFKIQEAEDKSEIITKVIEDQYNKNRIKYVISDEHMEFMNGSDAVRFLKKLEKNRKIRPIVFTSNSTFENYAARNHMRDIGFEFFLSKPCIESEVYTLLKEWNIIP